MAQKPRRERRRISQVAASDGDVGSEPFETDVPVDFGMETAAIGDVTPAMMDDAAHRAAEAFEAAAHHAVIEAGHDDGEHADEPMPQAETAMPIRSESDGSAVGSGLSDPAIPPVGIENMEASNPGEAIEETPVSTLPSVEAFAPSAPADEAAASVIVEVPAVEETLAVVADEMVPSADAPVSATRARERTGETPRRSLPLPGETIGAYGAQVVEMLAANMAATGQFLTALMGATSVKDVVAVNNQHMRRQVELLTAQGRQLTTLARTITLDAMKPFSPSSTDH